MVRFDLFTIVSNKSQCLSSFPPTFTSLPSVVSGPGFSKSLTRPVPCTAISSAAVLDVLVVAGSNVYQCADRSVTDTILIVVFVVAGYDVYQYAYCWSASSVPGTLWINKFRARNTTGLPPAIDIDDVHFIRELAAPLIITFGSLISRISHAAWCDML
ncbi:hypothetical protein B0H17DRAFT_1204265 [Mycena rosella]|uniref:Uncharacterized protein n=1 Tax=Mycena rosella TaxID=1033263 RepID=A0AAD7GFG4_MYCRO|nr:hypothetical protein B0H17DRAFT_1204265 [Mycena rosella]